MFVHLLEFLLKFEMLVRFSRLYICTRAMRIGGSPSGDCWNEETIFKVRFNELAGYLRILPGSSSELKKSYFLLRSRKFTELVAEFLKVF
jgi:hypothetical protein